MSSSLCAENHLPLYNSSRPLSLLLFRLHDYHFTFLDPPKYSKHLIHDFDIITNHHRLIFRFIPTRFRLYSRPSAQRHQRNLLHPRLASKHGQKQTLPRLHLAQSRKGIKSSFTVGLYHASDQRLPLPKVRCETKHNVIRDFDPSHSGSTDTALCS